MYLSNLSYCYALCYSLLLLLPGIVIMLCLISVLSFHNFLTFVAILFHML